MSAPGWLALAALLGAGFGLALGSWLGRRRGAGADSPAGEASESVSLELAGLRELARLVAHDIRNSLSVLYSSVDLLQAERTADERAEMLAALNEEADRMQRSLHVLGERTRPEGGAREPVATRAIVGDAILRAERLPGWRSACEVGHALGEGLMVEADRTRLTDGLAHLLLILGSGGASRLRIAEEADADTVHLCIDGSGGTDLPPELLSEGALEASSGPVAGGVLGLCLARRAIREHGGTLRLRSAAGATIELPRSR